MADFRNAYELGRRKVDAVNAWADDDAVVVALRCDGEWESHRLTADDADQLQGMLYLLAKNRYEAVGPVAPLSGLTQHLLRPLGAIDGEAT